MEDNNGWKTRTIILGGLLGLVIGIVAAFFFIKNQPKDASPRKITSKDGMNLGIGAVSLIKQIADLGK